MSKIIIRAFGRAIKLFPNYIQLWEIGAYYNLEILQNPLKARQILLKGLVFVSHSEKLWAQLLSLETQIQLLIFQREMIAKQVLKDQKEASELVVKDKVNIQTQKNIGIIESDSDDEEKEKEKELNKIEIEEG